MFSNKTVVTGDRPTGALHLGHYVGSLVSRLSLQDTNPMYVLIADTQVLNNDVRKAKDVRKNTLEVMRDYLATGLDPEKCTIFLQSRVLELFELTGYLANIVALPHVKRIPTIKSENELYNTSLNMGFLNYPISQTADILLFGGELVPVGIDQMPILEFGNDVIDRFHHLFKPNMFKAIQPLLSENSKLTGVDGKQKMSKSLGNAIMLGDEFKLVKEKVFQMYTDPDHIRVTDPGKVEGNVVFQFLEVFHKDKDELEELKAHYRKGGLGDVKLKGLLVQDLEQVLEPIRTRRAQYTDEFLLEVLDAGTKRAQQVAQARMEEIRQAIFG